MRSILRIVLKDLRRRLAEPGGVLMSMAIPLVIAGTMALTFTGGGQEGEDHPVLRVVLADLDGTPLSSILSGASNNAEASKHLDVKLVTSREAGMQAMREEDYAALLVIPKGFSRAILDGEQADLELIKNPAQRIMPVAVEQAAQVGALYASAVTRFLTPEDRATLRGLLEGEGWNDSVRIAALITGVYDKIRKADDVLFPPSIELETKKDSGGETNGFDFTSWMFPGMIVMGLLFVAMQLMKDILREQEAGTLRRQLAAAISPAALLFAKILASAAVASMALALMLACGSILFGIHWGSPAPLLAASVLVVLAVTGFASIVFSVARTEAQGDALGGILIMLMSLVGGAFVPPQLLPSMFRNLSTVTVNYWGNEAFRALAAGGGWAGIASFLPALAAMGVVFTTIGMLALSRRVSKGAA